MSELSWPLKNSRFGDYTHVMYSVPSIEPGTNCYISYISWFDCLGIEPTIPQVITLDEKALKYRWSTQDDYPPHLESIPRADQVWLITIFDTLGLAATKTLLPKVVPKQFMGSWSQWMYKKTNDLIHGKAYEGWTIADMEKVNKGSKKTGTDVMKGDNIGHLSDWWSDARFAQQQFTGTNPTTITQASTEWINIFRTAATKQGRKDAHEHITGAGDKTLYVQDCSYFRKAVKAQDSDVLVSKDPGADDRYACATVTLFHLHSDGKLHPLAIIIDWKRSMEKSVIIFNKRLQPHSPFYATPSEAERTDWPWRYAKTCAQTSDWIRHEITIHLVNTHLVEEVIIVAANRVFPSDHSVFRLLEPHWLRTLSLNAAARNTLIPNIICDLIGFDKTQSKAMINHAFDTFDFTGRYIPNDLRSRGFPLEELDSPKFKNYAYARNMKLMWHAIRSFVGSMLELDYAPEGANATTKGNRKFVADDDRILAWCYELRTQDRGRLSSFPNIRTREQLIDAVTMCIHIASPQHTAVNYLQNFYQSFVIAKPPALYTPLPTDLVTLLALTEADLVDALPIGRQRDWLLSAQIPWLLSFRVANDLNLITYAASIWNIYKKKRNRNEKEVKEYADVFYQELRRLITVFEGHNRDMEPSSVPYIVMDPKCTAVSILI